MIEYCVFILSYKRANNVKTHDTLRRLGYTGEIFVVCGNDEPQMAEYKDQFGNKLIVFDKYKYMDSTDTIDQGGKVGCVVYARRAIFDIAHNMGVSHFVVLDDDYNNFSSRHVVNGKLKHDGSRSIRNLDKAFGATFEFLMEANADVVCWAQDGDFIGGINSVVWKRQLSRKAMNTWFCRTDRPLDFKGSTNEDTNYYVSANMRGEKCFTIANADVSQTDTQQSAGGLTEIYKKDGTYVKSMYSVVCQPSCVKIARMGATHFRWHHNISWANCAPEIISEAWKKQEEGE